MSLPTNSSLAKSFLFICILLFLICVLSFSFACFPFLCVFFLVYLHVFSIVCIIPIFYLHSFFFVCVFCLLAACLLLAIVAIDYLQKSLSNSGASRILSSACGICLTDFAVGAVGLL